MQRVERNESIYFSFLTNLIMIKFRNLFSAVNQQRLINGQLPVKRYKSALSSQYGLFLKKDELLSYYHRVGSEPLIPMTFAKAVDNSLEKFGDRLAVVECVQGIQKTFSQLHADVCSLASGLLHLRCQPGDRIAVWSPNRYEWLVTQLAAAKTGSILVPLNSAFQPPEVDYCLAKMGVKTLVISDKYLTQDYYQMISGLVPEIEKSKPSQHIKSKRYPSLETIITLKEQSLPGTFAYKEVLHMGNKDDVTNLNRLRKKIQIDDSLVVLLTSGTTGRPKAATLSNLGLFNTTHYYARNFGHFEQQHTVCAYMPLFHGFGLVTIGYLMVLSGSTFIFPSSKFDPPAILKSIEKHKCSTIYGTPTMYVDLNTHHKSLNTDLSSIKTVFCGGSVATVELIHHLRSTFPNATRILNGYGISEVSALTSLYRYGEGEPNNVGKVIDHIEVKVVDENDAVVPMGTPGEICSRGFHLMKGYWDDELNTRKAIKNGWYHSGDIGTLSADGILNVLGRKIDMIIRGGVNIYPKEIEDVLVTHPKIADAQVIGIPEERLGEEVCAWIQLFPNENLSMEEVKEFCKNKLAHFKIPKIIRFVNEFPLTASGKVSKLKIREIEKS